MAANQLRLVFWETTSGCNLECLSCRRIDVAEELARQDMTTEQGMRFMDLLAECGKPILVFSGGEPLYRKDIFDLAKHAKSRGLTTVLATNGTLIDDATARRIVCAGFQRVAIRIAGADAETHDRYRGIPGSFARALSGFLRLKRQGMSMQIDCTLARHNASQHDRLSELALAVGADALHIFMLVPVGCGAKISGNNQLPVAEYESILNWSYDKSKEGKLQTKPTCSPHCYRILPQQAKAEGVKLSVATHEMDVATRAGLADSAVCFVSHKGEVYPCGYLPVVAGNVPSQSFCEIWDTSSVFASLRDSGNVEDKWLPVVA